MWVFIPLGGFALGVLVGRWWTVAVAVPFGVYIAASNDLEGHLGVWVASMLSVLLALAIAAGVVLHRLQRRGRRLRA